MAQDPQIEIQTDVYRCVLSFSLRSVLSDAKGTPSTREGMIAPVSNPSSLRRSFRDSRQRLRNSFPKGRTGICLSSPYEFCPLFTSIYIFSQLTDDLRITKFDVTKPAAKTEYDGTHLIEIIPINSIATLGQFYVHALGQRGFPFLMSFWYEPGILVSEFPDHAMAAEFIERRNRKRKRRGGKDGRNHRHLQE